jgi:anti-anti-sigma regulatory factor
VSKRVFLATTSRATSVSVRSLPKPQPAGDVAVQVEGSEHSEALAHAIALNDSNVTVDLSEVGSMDGSTIRTLIRAHAFLDARSRSLTLRSPFRCAALVIRVSGLDDLVAVRPSPSEPLESMTSRQGDGVTVRTL